jgi:hypothetical protein
MSLVGLAATPALATPIMSTDWATQACEAWNKNPILTDDKGGSARGAKLTFDLADDKILIENEGPGRAATVIRS